MKKSISKIDLGTPRKFWEDLYGQVGQDFRQPDLEKDVPAMAGDCFSWSLKVHPDQIIIWIHVGKKFFLSSTSIQLHKEFSCLFKGNKENMYVPFYM